jgi:HAD superfamily hydrolase (TIGR01509 family)
MIKAIIFDFDGLILDTETPDYQAWQWVFAQYGVELILDVWIPIIGSTSDLNLYQLLSEKSGRAVNREDIREARRTRMDQLMESQEILPGVLDVIEYAEQNGLSLGVASSSVAEWVHGNLKRLNLIHRFKTIRTAEDVEKTKPDPALYRLVVQDLGVQPHEAVALEDSENGVKAAKAAGLFCVAVPNPLQRHLDYAGADMRLESLADLPFDVLT